MEYGLIGGALGHSYSKLIHEQLCGYSYQLCPLPTPEEAHAFLQKKEFRAINVTIPYKQLVIPYCQALDAKAQAIGAVNTVVNRQGVLHGYNTDYDGFLYLARAHGVSFAGKTVLILGTGGTCKTVTAVARDQGAAQLLFASRTPGPGRLSYEQAQSAAGVQIIVNTSPAGMYPQVDALPLEPAAFPRLEAVLDVVYNPLCTRLVLAAKAAGVAAAGGLEMLVAQALYAAGHFTGQPQDEARIAPLAKAIRADRANISLVGMPSCGKTTLGRQLAKAFGKTFVDLDAEIEKTSGRSIPAIFEAEGEAGFRRWEQQVTARFAKENGQVLSCGGGVVLRGENVTALRQNGPVVFIDRPLQLLRTGGHRPLSKDRAALLAMEARRRPLYLAAADIHIHNDGDVFRKAGDAAREALYAYFGTERP